MHVPLTPIRCLYRAFDLYPRKIGVVSGADRFTYAQFTERCERLGAGLLSLGVQPGDRVAYLSFNNHQLLEGYFGVLLAGAAVMPLNVRLTPFELAAILQHAEPRVLFFETDFAPIVEQLRAACPAVAHWIAIGEPYEALLARDRIARPGFFAQDETAMAELFYTSGSTGTPKGVALSHRTLYLHALAVAATFIRGDNHVEIHTIPLFHANGWGRAHSSTLFGLKQVLVGRQRTNIANPGQAASYSRIWGKNLAAIRIEDAPTSTVSPYPGSALTAYGNIMNAGPVFVASRTIQPGDESGGLYGAIADIIGHTRKVLMVNPDSCYLLANCVQNDV